MTIRQDSRFGQPTALDVALAAAIGPTLRQIVREEIGVLVRDLLADKPPELLSVRGLAKALGASPSSVHRLLKRGCPHVRVGDSPRFSLVDVTTWLREQGEAG